MFSTTMSPINLKNYTSAVPVERTIARIEAALANAGASGIAKEYKDGRLQALSFRVTLPTGKEVSVRLPADADAVWENLCKKIKRNRAGTREKLREQADRTSWKLMQDWCEVQLSLIAIQKVDFMQVFLAYVWDGKQTFYTALKGRGFAELPLNSTVQEEHNAHY